MPSMRTRRLVMAACAIVVSAVVAVLAGRGSMRSSAAADAGADVCVADAADDLYLLPSVPSCASGEWACRLKCTTGDGGSCLALAYSATGIEATRLYRRSCVLGAAVGCTNYAAGIWAGQASDAQLACARRTFERACSVNEPFGCGMVGRLLLESTDAPSYAEGRRYLEKSCDRVGGFSCRVLAKHLESGKLGSYQAEARPTLLRRACATGDPDACGEHATAAETFH